MAKTSKPRARQRAAKPDRVEQDAASPPERIAKRIARAGLCSRRQAEAWIEAGRVAVNGKQLDSPACTVTSRDIIEIDGKPLPGRERTRLWLFHKPAGCVTTNRDPEGRPTVFDRLPATMPRVISIGRLDINTEGLLLLTNDGGLARMLELPDTGWLRRYRVRAHGRIGQAELDRLAEGFAVDGMLYGPIEAAIDREQGSNLWLTLGLREGKNREVKKVLAALGLSVNRLIRVSYGPFQLGDLATGEVREIRGRTLRDQLGSRLIEAAGADFDAPVRQPAAEKTAAAVSRPASAKPAAGSRQKPAGPKARRKTGAGQMSEDAAERLTTRRGKAGSTNKPATGRAGQRKRRDADRRR